MKITNFAAFLNKVKIRIIIRMVKNLKNQLEGSQLFLAIYASIIIFAVYTCNYVYRKTFSAATYSGEEIWGMDAKILFVLFQIIGYCISKFLTVHILPGVKRDNRVYYILVPLALSELALVGFGAATPSLKPFFILVSALPLGFIYGVVFSYIEGRRISEILNVGLCVALVLASGIVKTAGYFIMDTWNVTEYWMPAVTGAVTFPFLVLFTMMLNLIPKPREVDVKQRSERRPMSKAEKKDFFQTYRAGILFLSFLLVVMAIFREIRDSFAADIWKELNLESASIFTATEVPITVFVLGLMLALVFIRNNEKAVNYIYLTSIVGGAVVLASTYLFVTDSISAVWWMVYSGLGLYMAYLPYTFLLERLIAALKVQNTAIFIIAFTDAFGYLGTMLVFALKNFIDLDISWTQTLIYVSTISGALTIVFTILTKIYFSGHIKRANHEN